MNEQEKINEITIGFLFDVLRRRILWLVLAVVIGAGAAFGFTKLLIRPVYSSRAEFSVENTSAQAGVMNSGYQQGAALFAANYANEVTGNVFLGEILKEYNKKYDKQMTLEQISAKISTTANQTLPIFGVRVSSTDRQEAYDILQVIEEKAPELLLNDSTKTYVNIKLIQYGHLATAPDSPNVLLNTAVGGILLFVIVYVICFLRAFLDKTVYSEETLKLGFGLPVIAQIPSWSNNKKRESGKKGKVPQLDSNQNDRHIKRDYNDRLLGAETPFSVEEAFRTLRTNLTYVAIKDNECPVFAITSSFAGAGKSLIIANTALSFVKLDKKVLLIDGDMRCPAQHKIFALPKEHYGLSEALAGIEENPLENAVVKNVRPGLDLMPCGHVPPNPAELLASERMEALLKEAKGKYDYIFLDLPPMLETTDASVVTQIVSAYILVVRAGYSQIGAVQQVVDDMAHVQANMAGFVLNDVNVKGVFGYYSHYSHYGKYGKYGKYAYRIKDES